MEVVVSSPQASPINPTAGLPRSDAPPSRDDPVAAPLSLLGLEFSLDTAPLDALEEVARSVTRARVKEWFSHFPDAEEAALLSTCHRVELLLLVSSERGLDDWRQVLPGNPSSWKLRQGRELVHHVFRVAAGRKSLALGEAEVRHQVRSAAGSVESRHPRSVLRELFVGAASSADEVSPSVPASHSIASVAVTRLLELVDHARPAVLVIGSGTIGRQVADRLAPSAAVTIVYHQRPPDDAFLATTGARAVPLGRLAEELPACDAVVTAAKFGNHGLSVTDLPRGRSLVLVDLGVPRNIDPNVRSIPSVRLVDLEELHALPPRFGTRRGDDARIAELADRLCDRIEPLLLEPWVAALRRAVEEVRRSEMAFARPFLGELDPSQEAAVDRLTQRLVARLLRTPTERIRSFPPGPEGDLQRRFALALLRPPSPDA